VLLPWGSVIATLFAAPTTPVRTALGGPAEPDDACGRIKRVLADTLSRPARIRQDAQALPRHTHLSDEALVALVARGDDSALGELYDRVGRVAYGIAYRILRDERLAEDAVQEGFLAVWRSAATFRAERAKASTWIVTLVHRRAVDIVRKEERRRAEPLEAEARPDAVDPAGSAEDAAWLGFERDRVQAALQALPDAQREAIELAYYGGYSQSELAERLGLPLGTIKSRMFAGLARLREVLDDTESERSWTPRLTS
jgi:RNA polymerase sigma factor (sigma-70 family)